MTRATLLGILCFVSARDVAAQASPAPATGMLEWHGLEEPVAVSLQSEQPLRVRFSRSMTEPALFDCTTPCELALPPDHYWLHVYRGPGTAAGAREVRVRQSTELTITPRSYRRPYTGLTLALIGATLFAGGLTCLLACSDTPRRDAEPDDDHASPDYQFPLNATVFLLSAMASAPLSIIGWIWYGQGYKPGVSYKPLP